MTNYQEQTAILLAEMESVIAELGALQDDETARGENTPAQLIRAYLTAGRWREVFLRTASRLANAELFFALLKEAIDDLVRGDRALVGMLKWLERKSAKVKSNHKPVAVRNFYLNRELSLARELSNARITAPPNIHTCSLALARGHELATALESKLASFHARARADALARDLKLIPTHLREREFDLAPDLALDLTLDLALIRSSTRSSAHTSAREIFRAVKLSQELHLPRLTQALKLLAVPSGNVAPIEMEFFAVNLRTIMNEHRDIGHDWRLTVPQWRDLAQYLAATKLLIECLATARVADKTAIENRLLLPPSNRNLTALSGGS